MDWILALAYAFGQLFLLPPPPKRRRPAHLATTCSADTLPLPLLPVTAIHGIPLNPLVKQ